MNIETKFFDEEKFNINDKDVVLLPLNYLSEERREYHSTSISFYKYAKNKIPISYFNEPEVLVEQRSSDWFAPELLFTAVAIMENPNIVEITLKLIEDFLTSYFKGQDTPNTKLEVYVKKTKKSKTAKISYEGDIEGITKLKKVIDKAIGN